VRIIKPTRIREYWRRHPGAKSSLEQWLLRARAAIWLSFMDVRETFPGADLMIVASGRRVVVFNIAGNRYRLITAIHFNRHKVFVLRFLTHAEYDKNEWKDTL
jgi:mRNA interferase HigB